MSSILDHCNDVEKEKKFLRLGAYCEIHNVMIEKRNGRRMCPVCRKLSNAAYRAKVASAESSRERFAALLAWAVAEGIPEIARKYRW